jgi:mRNA-degrading endonuclease RelE of RelBE toxin-antitoxin system
MAYRISITQEAKAHLAGLSAREQRIVGEGIAVRLIHQPKAPSRAIKPLRPNPFAGYELRLGDIRVFYNVDDEGAEVAVLLIGRKVGNALIVGGEPFHGHESDPAE